MTGGKTALDETEVYKRRLRVLEGDKEALTERFQVIISGNQTTITNLKDENKELEKKLRSMKNQPKTKHGGGLGQNAIENLDQKVCTAIKKHNAIRAEAERKEKEIVKLQEEMLTLNVEENQLKGTKEGKSPEGVMIRDLENRLQKAQDKHHDALYMTKTYDKIIDKLNQDRLDFNNILQGLEDELKDGREEIAHLQGLCDDAESARDKVKQELSEADRAATADRIEREAEKKRLISLTEEQHRKYEAMERIMKSSHGDPRSGGDGDGDSDGVKEQLQTSEAMMRRIQEATGVMDVQEVLERFKSQKDTESKLTKVKEESTVTLEELKGQLSALEKTFEAMKYSGEARNTSNQRMVSEFEKYLHEAEKALAAHQTDVSRNEALLVQLHTGVDHLHDKVDTLKPVEFRAAAQMSDKLTESKLRLVKLIEELDQRKGELAEVDSEAPMILPPNNARVKLAPAEGEAKPADDDEDPTADNEAISRDQIKRQAQILIEQNASQQGPGGGRGGKKGGRK